MKTLIAEEAADSGQSNVLNSAYEADLKVSACRHTWHPARPLLASSQSLCPSDDDGC